MNGCLRIYNSMGTNRCNYTNVETNIWWMLFSYFRRILLTTIIMAHNLWVLLTVLGFGRVNFRTKKAGRIIYEQNQPANKFRISTLIVYTMYTIHASFNLIFA